MNTRAEEGRGVTDLRRYLRQRAEAYRLVTNSLSMSEGGTFPLTESIFCLKRKRLGLLRK